MSELNPVKMAAIGAIAGIAIGGATGYVISRGVSKSKAKKRKKASKKRSGKRKLKFGSKAYRKRYLSHRRRKQKQPHTAGKRKDTSHRRIRYTKNNQPYIIMPNGKARFISKRSVSSSRKRKGGKY
jgi:membrane protein YqaA with SNARE-associated domain